MKTARNFVAVAIVVAGLAVAPAGSAMGGMGVGPAGVSTMSAPFDQQFIDMMAAHHGMAVEMAKMALMRAKHPELRQLATSIIRAQSQEIAAFHRLRKSWYGDARFRIYRMDEMMMRSMGMGANEMKDLMRSSRFDEAFINAMIPHHAGAVTMARWEAQMGEHKQLRAIAANIIRDQAKEIGQMIGWRLGWYGA